MLNLHRVESAAVQPLGVGLVGISEVADGHLAATALGFPCQAPQFEVFPLIPVNQPAKPQPSPFSRPGVEGSAGDCQLLDGLTDVAMMLLQDVASVLLYDISQFGFESPGVVPEAVILPFVEGTPGDTQGAASGGYLPPALA